MNDFFNKMEENRKKLDEQDAKAKTEGKLVGRYIQEPRGDGYAIYRIVRENKKTVRIQRVTGIGDDWSVPYWGDETTVDKEYAEKNIGQRDFWSNLVASRKK